MRYFICFVLFVFLISCSSPKYSDNFIYGEKLYTNFINSYLKGEPIAEIYFLKSVDNFQRSDDFCNLSRIYLTKYLLNEEFQDSNALTQGRLYAEVGNCEKEKNILAFFEGKEYREELFDSYYKEYLTIIKKAELSRLLEENKHFPSYFYSRVLRKSATQSKDGDTAIKLIEKAIEIDRFQGWTLNLWRDYNLLKKFQTSEEAILKIKIKVDIFEKKLHKK